MLKKLRHALSKLTITMFRLLSKKPLKLKKQRRKRPHLLLNHLLFSK